MEFARQFNRQHEALSCFIVDKYLKGRDLCSAQERVPTLPSLKLQRENLEKKIVNRLVDDYRSDPDGVEKEVIEAVQALVTLRESDQSLQGIHQLAAGETVWGNSSVNSSING